MTFNSTVSDSIVMPLTIGTEVTHVTLDSDTTFKFKMSKVKVTRPLYSARP